MQNPITPHDIVDGAILLIDKPAGITSFDVIRKLRAISGIKKMGHAGTLDPFATGLLIIAVGSGTKQLSEFLKLPKMYLATIAFGIQTDTGDSTGNVVASSDHSVAHDALEHAVLSMIGAHDIPVPAYSAIKRGGRPLYAYARAGEEIEIPRRMMQVNDARLLAWDPETKTARVAFAVESGVYIRSLAEEVASRLGTVGHLAALRRESIGAYSIENSFTL